MHRAVPGVHGFPGGPERPSLPHAARAVAVSARAPLAATCHRAGAHGLVEARLRWRLCVLLPRPGMLTPLTETPCAARHQPSALLACARATVCHTSPHLVLPACLPVPLSMQLLQRPICPRSPRHRQRNAAPAPAAPAAAAGGAPPAAVHGLGGGGALPVRSADDPVEIDTLCPAH